ncbi:outer membrane protein [Rhodoplanes azumiensis]|uniref:Outer membrane protein n=1 Tax=Rhodoplanes azumiensis TaxID=1897628 RepID=A0ABW5AST3_9BRAD
MIRQVVPVLAGLTAATMAQAADLAVKAPPAAAPSWTGVYIGATLGGAWADRDLSLVGNDVPAANRLAANTSFPGNQPVVAPGVSARSLTGGLEAGFDVQASAAVVAGFVADVSLMSLEGSGAGTNALLPPSFTQTLTVDQKVDWWGTLRARLGWLATENLLLYATGGLAYGHVERSAAYRFDGPAAILGGGPAGVSYLCAAPGQACFSGSASSVELGFTAGAGGELRLTRQWSLKAEYLYVSLGRSAVDSVAVAVFNAGDRPSSFNADFGRTDFQVARGGAVYRF